MSNTLRALTGSHLCMRSPCMCRSCHGPPPATTPAGTQGAGEPCATTPSRQAADRQAIAGGFELKGSTQRPRLAYTFPVSGGVADLSTSLHPKTRAPKIKAATGVRGRCGCRVGTCRLCKPVSWHVCCTYGACKALWTCRC